MQGDPYCKRRHILFDRYRLVIGGVGIVYDGGRQARSARPGWLWAQDGKPELATPKGRPNLAGSAAVRAVGRREQSLWFDRFEILVQIHWRDPSSSRPLYSPSPSSAVGEDPIRCLSGLAPFLVRFSALHFGFGHSLLRDLEGGSFHLLDDFGSSG